MQKIGYGYLSRVNRFGLVKIISSSIKGVKFGVSKIDYGLLLWFIDEELESMG